MIPPEWISQAAERLHGQIKVTPLTYDKDNNLYIKWENQQLTGSFKVRGALNKVGSLVRWEVEQGLVAASAGNHGQGVALAAQKFGTSAHIFASFQAVPAKLEAMQSLGAELHLVDGGYAVAETEGIAYAQQNQMTWVSPYNDGQVIAGQATIGLELLHQLSEQHLPPEMPYACVVPAGGGGLVSGVASALRTAGAPVKMIAVQSEASAFLHALYQHRRQEDVIEQDSVADGLSGAVEDRSITIPMVRRYVDGFVLVTEEEIERAIATAWFRYHEKIEGSAAVALAAVLTGKVAERPSVVIISGGNIQPERHAEICRRWQSCLFQVEEI